MDYIALRNSYREALEKIARRVHVEEVDVAEKVLSFWPVKVLEGV